MSVYGPERSAILEVWCPASPPHHGVHTLEKERITMVLHIQPGGRFRRIVVAAVSLCCGSSIFVSAALAQDTVPNPSTPVSSTLPSASTPPSPTTGVATTTTPLATAPIAGATGPTTPAPPTAPIAPTSAAAQAAATFVPGAILRQGSKGDDVRIMKQKFDLLRYDVGNVDGRFDGQTWQGLMAFQKLHGLKRTGKFDLATQQELANTSVPGGLIPNGGLPRIEIDVSRQVLLYFDEYGLNRVVAISTGSGKNYCETSKITGKQNCGNARTPRGNYRIERRIKGKRESDLGTLWSPMYFTGGFAIHGSPSIPAYAASHGCVRITNRTADWMFDEVKTGTPVYVFD